MEVKKSIKYDVFQSQKLTMNQSLNSVSTDWDQMDYALLVNQLVPGFIVIPGVLGNIIGT